MNHLDPIQRPKGQANKGKKSFSYLFFASGTTDSSISISHEVDSLTLNGSIVFLVRLSYTDTREESSNTTVRTRYRPASFPALPSVSGHSAVIKKGHLVLRQHGDVAQRARLITLLAR